MVLCGMLQYVSWSIFFDKCSDLIDWQMCSVIELEAKDVVKF